MIIRTYATLAIALFSLVARAEPDTFRPVTRGNPPQNFDELWSGFDPCREPLDSEWIYTNVLYSLDAPVAAAGYYYGLYTAKAVNIYPPYPYRDDDGRNAIDGVSPHSERLVRGGSWRDWPYRATSSFRLPYRQYQRVFNVGFRVILEETPAPVLTTAAK